MEFHKWVKQVPWFISLPKSEENTTVNCTTFCFCRNAAGYHSLASGKATPFSLFLAHLLHFALQHLEEPETLKWNISDRKEATPIARFSLKKVLKSLLGELFPGFF